MAIRRERKRSPTFSNELPPAKLYLDEIQEIASILASPNATAPSVVFSVGDLRCDTLEDLQKIGGRTTDFGIDVVERLGEEGIPSYVRSLHSWLTIRSTSTYLNLDCASEADFWPRRSRVAEIFEPNTIWWRRAAQSVMARISWWLIGLFALVGFVADIVPPQAQTVHVGLWGVLTIVAGIVIIASAAYLCLFRHSVVILRYSHEGDARAWLRTHASQIAFLVLAALLGALAKGALDHLWPSR